MRLPRATVGTCLDTHWSPHACTGPGTHGTLGGEWGVGRPVEPDEALHLPVHTLRGVGLAGAWSKH